MERISPCARVSQLSRCRLKFKLLSCSDPPAILLQLAEKTFLLKLLLDHHMFCLLHCYSQKKRPVGHPRKTSTNNELESRDCGIPRHSQKQSAGDCEQENSSSLTNKPSTKEVRWQYSYKLKEIVI